MKIIKKINTSAAIALDSFGNEIVVLGKGIGYPPVPYELDDLSRIERTFYDVNSKYYNIIKEIPIAILNVSAEIAEMAEFELKVQLNPNLPFTLSDHLSFAVERLKKGMDLTGAISYDIKHLYPKETKLGEKALDLLKKNAKIILPESEVVSIAMHLINAESRVDDIFEVLNTVKIIQTIKELIEKHLNISLNEESYEYSRFITHLRYLIQRLSRGESLDSNNEVLVHTLSKEYPLIEECVNEIIGFLEGTWGWKCNNNEKLYLMLHIYRVQQ